MRKSIILDTNLFVLYLVGLSGRERILQHRRTTTYTQMQFDVLIGLLLSAKFIILTPHVIVETSNLVRQTVEPHRSGLTRLLRAAIVEPRTRFRVRNISTRAALDSAFFTTMGFTDAALIEIVDGRTVLLTDDRDLFRLCSRISPLNCLDFRALSGA